MVPEHGSQIWQSSQRWQDARQKWWKRWKEKNISSFVTSWAISWLGQIILWVLRTIFTAGISPRGVWDKFNTTILHFAFKLTSKCDGFSMKPSAGGGVLWLVWDVVDGHRGGWDLLMMWCLVRLLFRDTLELMEVTREDAGIYQCLVDNGGSPITQEQKVAIIGMMMLMILISVF